MTISNISKGIVQLQNARAESPDNSNQLSRANVSTGNPTTGSILEQLKNSPTTADQLVDEYSEGTEFGDNSTVDVSARTASNDPYGSLSPSRFDAATLESFQRNFDNTNL